MPAPFVAEPPRTAAEQLSRIAQLHPHSPALLDGATWLSFTDVDVLTRRVAANLAHHGAGRGDRVVLYLRNGAPFRLLEHAALAHGLVRVALSPRLHVREAARIVVDSGATIVCCGADDAAALEDACREARAGSRVLIVDGDGGAWRDAVAATPPLDEGSLGPPHPEDLAMLLYSSGTTGRPKGATVTHRAWVAQFAVAMGRMPAIGPGDVVLSVAPMAHFGGSISLDCAMSGAATVTLDRFDIPATLEAIVAHRVTVLPLAPTMLKMLLDEACPDALRAAGARLRAVPYGGSPVNAETLVAAARALPGRLYQYYGLSETLAPVSCLSAANHDEAAAAFAAPGPAGARGRRILESAGQPAPGTELRFEGAGPGPQELAVRSALVSRGYWNNVELTRATFADGWFTTGDIGYLDEDGYLHLVDRKHDMIVSGGFNVYPGEVERVIASLPEISDVAVVGIPHPRWGEGVHATVVPRAGRGATGEQGLEALRDAVLESCRQQLAGYKKPTSIEFVDELPRTALGKTDRKAIRARHNAVPLDPGIDMIKRTY